jgi:hypothetical protein
MTNGQTSRRMLNRFRFLVVRLLARAAVVVLRVLRVLRVEGKSIPP